MKKSIANKIERLLCSRVQGTNSSKNDTAAVDPEDLHHEKNPDRPVKTKLPQRLLDLLRPKQNTKQDLNYGKM